MDADELLREVEALDHAHPSSLPDSRYSRDSLAPHTRQSIHEIDAVLEPGAAAQPPRVDLGAPSSSDEDDLRQRNGGLDGGGADQHVSSARIQSAASAPVLSVDGSHESHLVASSLFRVASAAELRSAGLGEERLAVHSENVVLERLRHGGIFVKYHRNASTDFRMVWVSQSLETVHWCEPKTHMNVDVLQKAGKSMETRNITGVFQGMGCPTSKAFTKLAKNPKVLAEHETRCFSIQTKDRVLDLECVSRQERDLWVLAFRYLTQSRGGRPVPAVNGSGAAIDSDGDSVAGGKHLDPTQMSHEMLIEEVLLLRDQVDRSVPKVQVRELKRNLTALQNQWAAGEEAEKRALRDEIRALKLRYGVEDFDDYPHGASVEEMSDDNGAGLGALGSRRGSRVAANSRAPNTRQLTAALDNLDGLLKESREEISELLQVNAALEFKLNAVVHERNELHTCMGLTIGALALPSDDPESIRTEAEFEADRQLAAGYLDRHMRRVSEGSVSRVPIEEIVAKLKSGEYVVTDKQGEPVAAQPQDNVAARLRERHQQREQMAAAGGIVANGGENPIAVSLARALPPPSDMSDETNKRLRSVARSLQKQWTLATMVLGKSDGLERLPKWVRDSDAPECMRCSVTFTVIRRRHHCRLCGGVYCGDCSNKRSDIAKFAVKDVRVCHTCFGVMRAAEGLGTDTIERLSIEAPDLD